MSFGVASFHFVIPAIRRFFRAIFRWLRWFLEFKGLPALSVVATRCLESSAMDREVLVTLNWLAILEYKRISGYYVYQFFNPPLKIPISSHFTLFQVIYIISYLYHFASLFILLPVKASDSQLEYFVFHTRPQNKNTLYGGCMVVFGDQ